MSRPLVRTVSAWLCAAAVSSMAQRADAYLTYPAIVQSKLQLPHAPDCSICHRDNQTESAASATQAFANELKSLGLPGDKYTPAAESTLRNLLQQLVNCNIDSDGDGVSDVEELRNGTDPNDGPGPAINECLNPPPPMNGGDAGASSGGAAGDDGNPSFSGFSQSCYTVKTYKGPPPEYGCSLNSPMHVSDSAWGASLAAIALLVATFRRRRG